MGQATDGRRALWIDNEPKLLQHGKELLSRDGFDVATCPDPTQAIALLKAQVFDVVLLDIRMPGLEGTDLLPLIKKIRPELPVILVSAYCDEAQASYYHGLGASGLIAKPFSPEQLRDTVAKVIHEQEEIPVVLTSLSLREGRDQIYRKLILAALRRTNWNQVKAAELLGVSRFCLIRWIKKLGIAY
jgi:DNA-binding NtrC family response regulator